MKLNWIWISSHTDWLWFDWMRSHCFVKANSNIFSFDTWTARSERCNDLRYEKQLNYCQWRIQVVFQSFGLFFFFSFAISFSSDKHFFIAHFWPLNVAISQEISQFIYFFAIKCIVHPNHYGFPSKNWTRKTNRKSEEDHSFLAEKIICLVIKHELNEMSQ